jgi:hypothetical protein
VAGQSNPRRVVAKLSNPRRGQAQQTPIGPTRLLFQAHAAAKLRTIGLSKILHKKNSQFWSFEPVRQHFVACPNTTAETLSLLVQVLRAPAVNLAATRSPARHSHDEEALRAPGCSFAHQACLGHLRPPSARGYLRQEELAKYSKHLYPFLLTISYGSCS